MAIPFYKKRPQWWIKLLDIFHITEKQYWIAIVIAFVIALVVLALMSCKYYTCQMPSQKALSIYYFQCCCIPTAPFGYYWSEYKTRDFPESWLKDILLRGNRGSIFVAFAVLFSLFIVIYALIKHYRKK